MKTRNAHPMHRGAVLLALSLSLPIAPACAQSAGQWGSPGNIYDKVCARCHETAVAPALLGRDLQPDYVRLVVSRGLRAMPAFRPTDFSDDELAALAGFVQKQPPRTSVQPPRAAADTARAAGDRR